MVEQSAVNRSVVGSSPTSGAIFFCSFVESTKASFVMESTVTPESSIRNQAPKVVQCSKVYKAVLFL